MAHDVLSTVLVACEGYVNVGSTLNSRKKLYARLEDNVLVFYKSAPLKAPKGNISLADVKRLTGALPAGLPPPPANLSPSAWFAMECGSRTFVFNAGTAAGRDQWIGVVKDLITTSRHLEPGQDELVCGDLIKCDGKGKSWKHRSIVVSFSSRSMMYFEKAVEISSRIPLSPQPNEEPGTVVPLSDTSASTDFSFSLTAQGRKIVFTASDSREYAAWLHTISRALQSSSEPKRSVHTASASLDLTLGSGSSFDMVNIARSSVCLREGVMKRKTKMKMWSPRYYVLQHVVERGAQDVLLSDAPTKAEYVRGLVKNSCSCRSLVSAAFHTSKSGKATKGGCRIDLTFDDEVLPLRCADFSEAKQWVDQFNLVINMCAGMREPAAKELPPSHPLYMRPEKKDDKEAVDGEELQETDEFAKGILEKKKFKQWKPFLCSVNKLEEVPNFVFSSVPGYSGSSSSGLSSAKGSMVQSKTDTVSCEAIVDIELCTSGKEASEGRRFNLKLKSGQLICLRAKTFQTCSRWVAILDSLKSPEDMKAQEEFMPLPSMGAKISLGAAVSCVSEHLFALNLTLIGTEASRINPLVTAWVYDGEASIKDVTLSYPIVDVATDSTGMCVATVGLKDPDFGSSIVFTSNPLTADIDTAPAPNAALSPRRRFVDEPPPRRISRIDRMRTLELTPDDESPRITRTTRVRTLDLDEPPRRLSRVDRLRTLEVDEPQRVLRVDKLRSLEVEPDVGEPQESPLTPSTAAVRHGEASETELSEPSEAPPPEPALDIFFSDEPPPPPPSNPVSPRASPLSRQTSLTSRLPVLSRCTSPATPMDTPPSLPLTDLNEDMSELIISSRLELAETSHFDSPSSNPKLPPPLPLSHSTRQSSLSAPSTPTAFVQGNPPDSKRLSLHSSQVASSPPRPASPIPQAAGFPVERQISSALTSDSSVTHSDVLEHRTGSDSSTGAGLRKGTLKPSSHNDGEFNRASDSSKFNRTSDSTKSMSSGEKSKKKGSSVWVHLGSTEPRDCPPISSREEKDAESSGTPSRSTGGTGTAAHPFRVLVPLYTSCKPGSELVTKDHPEQVVVNSSSPDTLIRFSLFHVSKKDDPDSVNLKEAEELATCVTSLRALSSPVSHIVLLSFKPNIRASLQVQHLGPFPAEVSSCFGAIARKSFSFPSTLRSPQYWPEPAPQSPRPLHERASSMTLPSFERTLTSEAGSLPDADDEEFSCLVQEKLTQSPFTFSVPALVLQESMSARTALLRRLGEHIQAAKAHLGELKTLPEAMTAVVKAGVMVHPFVPHSRLASGLEAYMRAQEASLRSQELLLQMYQEPSAYLPQHSSCSTNPSLLGVPFRSSVAKKVTALRYVPTNLHLHTTMIRHQRKLADSHEREGVSTLYEITSVGASVDHVAGFKKGDISSLQADVHDMVQELATLDQAIEKAVNKELQDLEDKRSVVELKLQQAETDLLSRKECVFAQSLAVLVSSFVAKLQACVFGSSPSHCPAVLVRMAAIGFLFQVESLLSTIYDEAHMLADYEYSVRQLQRVQFRLVRRQDADGVESSAAVEGQDAPSYTLASQIKVRIQPPKGDGDLLFAPLKLHIPAIRKSGYTCRNMAWPQEGARKKKLAEPAPKIVVVLELPAELYSRLPAQLTQGREAAEGSDGTASPRAANLINVVSVFFNQGVNEMQSLAISLGKVDQQKEINTMAKHNLEAYANNFIAYCRRHPDAHSEHLIRAVRDGLEQLGPLLQGKQHKDIQLLKVCNRLSRLMCSGNVVSCKSAKDRTSMSITWETAMALQEWHGVRSRHIQGAMDLTRAHGVRRKNVLKNTRKKAYAFNAIQRRALPSALCPPDACCGKTQS